MLHSDDARALVLINEQGEIPYPINWILYAFSVYPEDKRSREQLLSIFEIEAKAYLRNPSEHRLSDLSKSLRQSTSKKAGQRSMAGYVMLAFQILFMREDESPTVYKAVGMVENAIKREMKIKQGKWPMKLVDTIDCEFEVRDVAAPTGWRQIEKAYRDNQCVAHLVAAELLCWNTLEFTHPFERSLAMDAVLVFPA